VVYIAIMIEYASKKFKEDGGDIPIKLTLDSTPILTGGPPQGLIW
jgi:hypothetical protein